MNACPRCGSTELETTILAEGQHYGRLDCRRCEAWIKWLPRPRVSWRSLRLPAGVRRAEDLPELVGTAKQVEFAESIRRPMIRKVWELGVDHRDLARAMASIDSAAWWIANRNAPTLDATAWPASWLPTNQQSTF